MVLTLFSQTFFLLMIQLLYFIREILHNNGVMGHPKHSQDDADEIK
jgi:hypothetical protein